MITTDSRVAVAAAPPCVLCGHSVARKFLAAPVPTLICENCGLVFTWPIDVEALRRLYRCEYNFGRLGADLYPPPSPWERQRAEWIVETLGRGTGPHRLLEVGCNAGALLSLLAASGFRVAGLEPGEDAAAFARERRQLEVSCGFWEDAEVEDESQDAVVMISVLEHLRFPVEAVAKVRRVLRPGGWFFCEIPNAHHERGFFIDSTWRGYQPTLEHLFCYSPGSITRLLLKAGLEAIDVRSYREVLQVRARRYGLDNPMHSGVDQGRDLDVHFDRPAAVAKMLSHYQRAARRKWPLHAARKAAEAAAVMILPTRLVDALRSLNSRRAFR